ncbi:MAG: peptidoglycan DD-metalloendopeptidase family protein [Cyclobacteriaceae bacterium]|nr:peptidoglycan DD-metalloendopeptidase family protein [Cyclobacteriaceae bacterium]
MAFYIPFILILKRTTFFKMNRAYLVLGLLLSFVLPLYNGFTTISSYSPPDLPFMEPIVTQTELVISKAGESSGSLNKSVLLLAIYLFGIAVRLSILTLSIKGILKLKKSGEIVVYRNLNVFKTNTSVPFSFFNYVFLPKTIDDQGILEHEAAHIQQYHWIDLLIVELVSIILWFNPVMIVYKRSLKQQHEYLADQTAIRSGIDIGEYLISIKRQIELAIPFPLTNEFYFLSIKNRINMLTKKRTSVYGLATYTIVLPLIICLIMAFSSRKHFLVIESGGNDSIQEQLSLCLPIDKKNTFLMESGYGERLHPVLGVMRLHTGIDLIAKEGVSVVSTQGGVVIKAQLAEAWGNIIVIQHDDTYATSYSHLKSMNVKEGDKVQKGQEIGLVGNTGLSTKVHLHFELLKNGKAIDPITYLPEIK